MVPLLSDLIEMEAGLSCTLSSFVMKRVKYGAAGFGLRAAASPVDPPQVCKIGGAFCTPLHLANSVLAPAGTR